MLYNVNAFLKTFLKLFFSPLNQTKFKKSYLRDFYE